MRIDSIYVLNSDTLVFIGYVKATLGFILTGSVIDSAVNAGHADNADTLILTLNFPDLGGTASDAQIPNDITIDSSAFADTTRIAASADTINTTINFEQLGSTASDAQIPDNITVNASGISALGDSLTAHDQLYDNLGELSGVDSTNIVDGKIGIGDVNNLRTILDSKLALANFVDSLNNAHTVTGQWNFSDTTSFDYIDAVTGSRLVVVDTLELITILDIDSTNILNDAIGFEDVNKLPEELALKMYITDVRQELSDTAGTHDEFSEMIGSVIDAQVPNTITIDLADTARAASLADTILATINFEQLGSTISDAQIPNDITIDSSAFADSARVAGTAISAFADSARAANVATSLTLGVVQTVTSLNIVGATLPFSYVNFAEFSAYPDFFSDLEDSVFVVAGWDSIGGGLFQTLEGYEVDTSTTLQDIELLLVVEVPPYYVGIDSIPYDIKTGGTIDSSDVSINILSYDLNGATTSLDSVLNIESKDAWTRHNDLTSLSSVGRYDKILILIRLRSYGVSWVARVGRMKIYWKEGS